MTAPAKTAKAPVTKSAETPVKPTETPEQRIPNALFENPILKDFCDQYLSVHDVISEYNKEVLAEKTSEWNAGKVLEKAREMARPTEKGKEPIKEVLSAVEAYENAVNVLAKARKNVLDQTSKELGITLSATAVRDPEVEAPLKEKRKHAIEIGNQLDMLAKYTNNEDASKGVFEFLAKFPMPAIGRDQVRTFGDDGKSTPKYRVQIEVSKDGEVLISESGFTKTALELTKPALGYERGKAPKADTLREAWEKAGNTPEETVTNPVEFEDNGLKFVITKK